MSDRRYDDRRGSSSSRGYDGRWRRVRDAMLQREPLCCLCTGRGRVTAATEVDHVIPLDEGGSRLDPGNLMPVCHPCHMRKSGTDRARARRREARAAADRPKQS